MRFAVSYGTAFNGTDPDRLVAFAQHAESLGFEALYVQDHIALYPGADYGAGPLPPTLPYLDPLDCLGFVAASTHTLLLGTGVLLLPYRHPVVLAKRLATIDVLSRGRMRLLTVGLGALPKEAHALGVDFRSRGRRADEAIDVMRLLWAGGPEGVTYHGEFFDFDELCSYPKPHETSTLPIHIGGSSTAAAMRTGRRGDGFFAGGRLTEDERDRQIELARKTAVDAGRDPADIEYTRWGSAAMSVEDVENLAEHGVNRLVVGFAGADPAEQHDQMSEFSERFDVARTGTAVTPG
ncbi:TIGR03619 family F420-dependent LLM class oxidoreductase [Nocardia sp. CDC153]|uniref:TIGR03619 family F420-dependent LLM class oxidoreductase n=1 Tax=Nocardia sp. CDC153 TaxID=3112167 RepID=UPI002DBF177A|nr:TIGR03619 family F420-dependent LLM class oxidoreductase [Nocardia sp. CDC153]MEC3956549.1 TIGR03619 family F420-dependent LLM class oxidoreductase [Nocardia sp. CDC153]